MTFADAIIAMKAGQRVRLPWWGGYWYIANGTLRIHDMLDHDFDAMSDENRDKMMTLSNMQANCWEIVRD